MKIGFLTPHLKVRGANRRIIEISNWWVKQGHKVVIYHSDGSLCKWMECLASVKPVKDCLKAQLDVLVITNRSLYSFAVKAKAGLRIFYVLLLYGNENKLKSLWYRIWLRVLGREYDLFMHKLLTNDSVIKVANSTGMKKELAGLGIEAELAVGGINPAMFKPHRKPVNKKKKVVLAVGDPLGWKGFAVTQKAMEIILSKRSDIVLKTYYKKTSRQDELSKVFSDANIFVSNQFKGGWNNPVAEAMACKTAVVCSDIPSVIDIAIHETTALKVRVNSPTETAEAIVRLADDPVLRKRLSENGYKQVRRFTWKRTAHQLMKIIEKYV